MKLILKRGQEVLLGGRIKLFNRFIYQFQVVEDPVSKNPKRGKTNNFVSNSTPQEEAWLSVLYQMHRRTVKTICFIGSEPRSYPSSHGIASEASWLTVADRSRVDNLLKVFIVIGTSAQLTPKRNNIKHWFISALYFGRKFLERTLSWALVPLVDSDVNEYRCTNLESWNLIDFSSCDYSYLMKIWFCMGDLYRLVNT